MTVTKKGKAVEKVNVKLTEQGPPKVKKIVNLGCDSVQSDIARIVRIFNNTDQAVPKGRTIHWKTDDGDKGSITLQSPLAPGESFDETFPQTDHSNFSCEAWYFGPPAKIVAKGKIKAVG